MAIVPTKEDRLERRRPAAQSGDLWALYTALECCYEGWPLSDPPQDRDRIKDMEIPAWLVHELQKLIWRGIHGKWPKGEKSGSHSRASNVFRDRFKHLARAYHVLKARAEGIPWETVFEEVSQRFEVEGRGKVAPRTLDASYRIVAEADRSKEGLRAFLWRPVFPVPQEWGP